MQVSLEYAKEHFAEFVSAANRGESVEIAQPEKPVLKLVLSSRAESPVKQGRRVLGAGRGGMRVPSAVEWRAMDAELEILMNDGPLLPPERG